VGEWVDGIEAGEFVPCQRSGHEEWWVMDHEGYGGMLTGECSPVEAASLAELAGELGEDLAAFAAFRDSEGAEYATVDGFREAFCGEWDSLADYAEQLAEDIGIKLGSGWPHSCIDWERAGRELTAGGDNWTAPAPGGLFVFRSL